MRNHERVLGACLLLGCSVFACPARGAADVQPYLEVDGKPVRAAAVRVSQEPSRITATFAPSREGTYSFGLSIEASEIAPLAPGMPRYQASSLTAPIVRRYPYDWTTRGQGNVLGSERLVMPGLIADGKVYLVDTHELFSLRIEKAGQRRLRAVLAKHRFCNDGGDAATPALAMKAGSGEQIDVLVFDSFQQAMQLRFGPAPAMRGWCTQCAYKAWTGEKFQFDKDDYRRTAEGLKGLFDYVVVREVHVRDWIPPLFHQQGIKVYAYLYFGALRRMSAQLSDELAAQIGLRGADGSLYTAPKSPNGAWLLCDVRRPEVRTRLVEMARAQIAAGFDGVFLDGYPFWADATGRIGGNCPGAACSLAYARWQLLRETKAAMRAANPAAVLGVLSNQIYDTLNEADCLMKERMYCEWLPEDRTSGRNRLGTLVRQDLDVSFDENEAPFAAHNLFLGSKGLSPISVWTAVHFFRKPTGLYYTDASDFPQQQLDQWLKTLRDVRTHGDIYLTKILPESCPVEFVDVATMRSPAACRVEFSQPVSIQEEGSPTARRVDRLDMAPGRRYTISAAP